MSVTAYSVSVKKQTAILEASGSYEYRLKTQQFHLGDYLVVIDSNGLRISDTYCILTTIPQRSFLQAATGMESVKEDRGSFSVKDKITEQFTDQLISEVEQKNDSINIRGQLSSAKKNVDYIFLIHKTPEGYLQFSASVNDSAVNRICFRYSGQQTERLYGLGMQYSHANFKGHIVPVFVSEQGIGRGDQPITRTIELITNSGGNEYTSYGSIPSFFSSGNYALRFDNYCYTIFDFKNVDVNSITFFSSSFSATFFTDSSLQKLVMKYTQSTGHMTGLPDWAHQGAILGLQGGTDEVIRRFETIEKSGAKISAVWIQDWVGQRVNNIGKQLWWNWELDTMRYNNWEYFLRYFRSKNIRVLGYINPFLVDPSAKGNFRTNYYRQAIDSNFLVKQEDGSIYSVKNTTFSSGILDLSNPDCVRWVKNIIKKELIQTGFDGWMADYAEALPYHSRLFSSQGSLFHNRYPEVWAQLNREAISESGRESDVFFFTRSAYTFSPKYATAFWLGDQNTNWGVHDGIKSAVTALATSAFTGMSIVHSDIGGYTSIDKWYLKLKRNEELLYRWIELSAFTPLFRTHEGFAPEANVQVYSNENTRTHFAYFSKLFNVLHPYRNKLIKDYQQSGKPVVQHPVLLNQKDSRYFNYTYRMFYLGDDLIIYPATEEGIKNMTVDLPAGKWRHLWTQKIFEGGAQLNIACPVGQPGVFTRYNTEVDEILAGFVSQNPVPEILPDTD